MKRVFLVALAVVLVVGLIFAGCAKEVTPTTPTTPTTPPTPTTPTTPTTPAAFEWPEVLSFLTHPSTSTGYIATASWTPVFETATGVKVRMTPMEGDTARWKLLKRGEKYDLTTWVSDAPAGGIEALGGMADKAAGPMQIRYVYRIINLSTGYAVRGDSYIESMADVKPGVSFAYDAARPSGLPGAIAFGAWAGLTPEEMVLMPYSDNEWAAEAVAEGKADVCNPPPASAYTFKLVANPHGARFMEFDPVKYPEAAERFLEIVPYYMFLTVAAGVPEAVGKMSPANVYVYGTLPSFDAELAYHMMKWLDENFDSYKGKDFRVGDMSLASLVELLPTFYLPIHEGCIEYLEEEGLWTDKMQSTWDNNIDLIDQYIDAFNTAIADAEAKGIAVDPTNDVWLEYWENYKKELGLRRVSPWV